MKSKVLPIALIVIGIAATLGGLYGQIFLAEDEGHHDGREFTFALEARSGADELVVESSTDNEIVAQVQRAGQPIGLGGVHGADAHFFVVSEDLSWFEHVVIEEAESFETLTAPAGEVRVIAQLSPSGGPDFLELGASAEVGGDEFDAQNMTETDEWTNGDITVRRQGFDYVLSEPFNGDDVFDGPALLTLINGDTLAFTHAHAEVVDGNRLSFATNLPGLGEFLAAVEFQHDGELVTALFRFAL